MKPHRRWLLWSATILAATLTVPHVTGASPAGGTSCEVAIPMECDFHDSKDFPKAAKSRVVKRLLAATEVECVTGARHTFAACIQSSGGSADITSRFRSGPVQVVRQVTPSGVLTAPRNRLELPIVYGELFETEVDQFGYRPPFAPGTVNFTNDGLILIRHENYLQKQTHDGSWVFSDLASVATAAILRLPDVALFEWVWDRRSAYSDQRINADALGRAYTLIQGGRTRLKGDMSISHRPYLLFSVDGGTSWEAAALPTPDKRPTWRSRIEHNDGNNDRSAPPPILMYDRNEDTRKRSEMLFLLVPHWRGGSLIIAPPTLVSEKSLLQENHSGAANSLVSTADRIYIVYPSAKSLPNTRGTPAYVVIFSKEKAAVEAEKLIGFGGEATSVDNHNVPGACIGTQQRIHVLLPGHQDVLRFRTGKLDKADVTWGAEELIGQAPTASGGYTYGSLNCDLAGNVYSTTRWAGDSYRFQLVFLHRKPDGHWSTWGTKPHQVLVDPGRAFYGAWRQKLTLDASGALFLWYSYYANQMREDELVKLKWRFPFENWTEVKESRPSMCVKSEDPRCWLHPMPEVNSVILRSRDSGASWDLLQ